jgi:hypothetical protein
MPRLLSAEAMLKGRERMVARRAEKQRLLAMQAAVEAKQAYTIQKQQDVLLSEMLTLYAGGEAAIEVIQQHVEAGTVQLNTVDALYGQTMLHIAATRNHPLVTQYLIECKANVNILGGCGERQKRKVTALHLAAQNGHTAIVELLLQADAYVNARVDQALTAQERAKSNTADNVETALFLAVKYGHLETVKSLVSYATTTTTTAIATVAESAVSVVWQSLSVLNTTQLWDTMGEFASPHVYSKILSVISPDESGEYTAVISRVKGLVKLTAILAGFTRRLKQQKKQRKKQRYLSSDQKQLTGYQPGTTVRQLNSDSDSSDRSDSSSEEEEYFEKPPMRTTSLLQPVADNTEDYDLERVSDSDNSSSSSSDSDKMFPSTFKDRYINNRQYTNLKEQGIEKWGLPALCVFNIFAFLSAEDEIPLNFAMVWLLEHTMDETMYHQNKNTATASIRDPFDQVSTSDEVFQNADSQSWLYSREAKTVANQQQQQQQQQRNTQLTGLNTADTKTQPVSANGVSVFEQMGFEALVDDAEEALSAPEASFETKSTEIDLLNRIMLSTSQAAEIVRDVINR